MKTPLGLALRGRFLVGSRPVDADFARRFVASAAENGIDVFRLHDPLNDVSNLREAAEAIVAAERDFEAGPRLQPGPDGRGRHAHRAREGAARARRRPRAPARPDRLAPAAQGGSTSSARSPRRAGCRSASTCQGSGGSALAATLAAARAGAQLIACAIFPLALTLHRVSGEALSEALVGMGLDPGIDVATLWDASDIVDEHIGDEPVAPLAPRIAVRAAQHDLPAGLVAGVDATLRAQGAGDRLDEVLEELDRDPRRGRVAAARRADRAGARVAGAPERALREPLPDDRRRAARARLGPLRRAARADRPGDRAARSSSRTTRRRRRTSRRR